MVRRGRDIASTPDTLRARRAERDVPASDPAAPGLRLTDDELAKAPAFSGSIGAPIQDATDPRWVLALRTAESLQGAVLTPESRQGLVRLGKVLGLTPFDANLVIAIVQDQARRGYAPQFCPAAGEEQLRMVPLPHNARSETEARAHRITMIALIIAMLIGVELIVLKWIFS